MFEYSLVPSGKARPLPIAVACMSEALLLTGLIVVPLLFVQSLPERGLINALMLAPVPVAPPSPPPPMLAAKKPRAAPVPRKFNPQALVSPVAVPKVVAIIDEAPPAEINIAAGGVPGGIPGVSGAGGTGFFSSELSAAPPPPPVKVAAPAPAPLAAPRQINVGGDVQAALLVTQIPPVYPRSARQARIQGNVMLQAVIGVDGKIKDLTVLSGHPFLVDAAMNAVRRWVYRPTVLNGVPVEVNTSIIVRFGLTS
jgi:protein TonB